VSRGLRDPAPGCRTPVAAPILVVRGSVPGIGNQTPDDELRGLGPNVTIQTMHGVGQLPHDEAPEGTLAMVERWLARSG